ncbi:hypothetical protein [Aeromonas caviae]|uniref:hypothetical protein n=1 Tax=Aeromonas caviae TaxID=648 RepID=UPI002B4A669B|nr:hypothetical protein [Aeromonas caviae]
MEIEYKSVTTLEEIANDAAALIPAHDYKINLLLAYELPANDLIRNELLDVQDTARQWSAEQCPENLYFNHGQYRVNGVKNIINELQIKPSSNRAIYSLIDQKTIMDSGDNPIPSFMLFQSILDDGVLYCNIYLRALEVSKFLRINLEEIRLNIEEISRSTLNFQKVKLTILACRAHHVPNFNPLEKPKLDLMSQYQIMTMIRDNRDEFIRNVAQMANIQTVPSSKSIKYILEIVDGEWKAENKGRIKSLLSDTVSKIDELVMLRRQHSHHDRVNELSRNISDTLRVLVGEFSA